MFKPLKTSGDEVKRAQKTLLYGHHGWGKTTQAAHLQELYGKTFIISGEAGLMSLSHLDIDYLAFNSWNKRGRNDPEKGIHCLLDIKEMVASDDFKKQGYKVIVLDSLTEAGDMLLSETKYEHRNDNAVEQPVLPLRGCRASPVVDYQSGWRPFEYPRQNGRRQESDRQQDHHNSAH